MKKSLKKHLTYFSKMVIKDIERDSCCDLREALKAAELSDFDYKLFQSRNILWVKVYVEEEFGRDVYPLTVKFFDGPRPTLQEMKDSPHLYVAGIGGRSGPTRGFFIECDAFRTLHIAYIRGEASKFDGKRESLMRKAESLSENIIPKKDVPLIPNRKRKRIIANKD